MKNPFYLMVFQILVGLWLMISLFILGFREFTSIVTNNLIFGAIVLLLGIGGLYYQKTATGEEGLAKKIAQILSHSSFSNLYRLKGSVLPSILFILSFNLHPFRNH